MQIIVSDHARERMVERLQVSEKKIQSLAEKAWSSNFKDTKVHGRIRSEMFDEKHDRIRSLMGYLFIFRLFGSEATLRTVIKPNEIMLPYDKPATVPK